MYFEAVVGDKDKRSISTILVKSSTITTAFELVSKTLKENEDLISLSISEISFILENMKDN